MPTGQEMLAIGALALVLWSGDKVAHVVKRGAIHTARGVVRVVTLGHHPKKK